MGSISCACALVFVPDWKSDPTAHENDHRFVVLCGTKPGPERLAAVELVKAPLVVES